MLTIVTPEEVELQQESIDITTNTVLSSVPSLHILNASTFEVRFEKMSVLADANEALTVTYDVIVVDDIRANEDIVIEAFNSWWSVPTGFEHPGRLRDGFNTTSPFFGDTSVHVNPAELNSVGIYLHRSSLVDTVGTEVNVAEEVVYRSCFTVLEGHTTVVLTVNLEFGLSFLNASVLSIGGQIVGSLLVPGDMANGTQEEPAASTVVVFDFGEIRNIPDNAENDEDVICAEIAAFIANMYAFGVVCVRVCVCACVRVCACVCVC